MAKLGKIFAKKEILRIWELITRKWHWVVSRLATPKLGLAGEYWWELEQHKLTKSLSSLPGLGTNLYEQSKQEVYKLKGILQTFFLLIKKKTFCQLSLKEIHPSSAFHKHNLKIFLPKFSTDQVHPS